MFKIYLHFKHCLHFKNLSKKQTLNFFSAQITNIISVVAVYFLFSKTF